MSQMRVRPTGPLRGQVQVPGDKSISHRALVLGAIADGSSRVDNYPAVLNLGHTVGHGLERLSGYTARAIDPVRSGCKE